MKKSMTVTLVLSGALLTGCDNRPSSNGWQYGDNQSLTNNTYWAGHGYWHAPYYDWYPYPYNYYRPGLGYYHGGIYSSEPEIGRIGASVPRYSTTSSGLHSSPGSSVSRGGFGSTGRGASS